MTHNKNPAQRAGAGGAKGNSHQSASYTKRRRSDKDAIHRHLIRITLFADKAAKRMQQCDKTLLQLRDDVMRSTAATKAKLPWIKLATFGDVLSDKKSLRHNANVKSISGVELDYDGEVIGIADAVALLGKLNCRGLLYSSPSHTTRAPRWRVLFPTSKALEPDMRHGLATWVDDRCGNIFAPESFVLSQAYFFGAARDYPDPDHFATTMDGGFIDQCAGVVRQAPNDRVFKKPSHTTVVSYHDPAIEAMMEKYAGAGVSTNPEDYWADDPNIEKKIIAALLVIPADINYHFWKRVGAAIYNALGDDGYPLFVEWSQGSSRHNKDEASNACEWIWPACRKMSRKVTVATIFYYANKKNPRWRSEVAA